MFKTSLFGYYVYFNFAVIYPYALDILYDYSIRKLDCLIISNKYYTEIDIFF